MAQLMRTSNPALTGDSFRTGEVAYGGESMTISARSTRPACCCSVASSRPLDVEPLLQRDFAGRGHVEHCASHRGGRHWRIHPGDGHHFQEAMGGSDGAHLRAAGSLVLGGISALMEQRFHGIAIQAVALTFGTLIAMLVAYRTGLIKVTTSCGWASSPPPAALRFSTSCIHSGIFRSAFHGD